MDCQIIPLTAQEQPFLWDMLYQAIYVPSGQDAFPRELIHQPALARYAQDWGRLGDNGFYAQDPVTRQPVGAIWLRLLTGANRGYGYFGDEIPELSMAVVPSCRAQGIGTRLLGCLLAAECARSAISLSVSAGNPAHRLYERFGFEIVSQTDASFIMLRKAPE